jgi:hypothetical protein
MSLRGLNNPVVLVKNKALSDTVFCDQFAKEKISCAWQSGSTL